ncbi:MAG TPA: neutral/alkaline non-lysosomal ceramidase N-terminal domain-containing protein, partial [Verrucomicrobiaceae bacterium]
MHRIPWMLARPILLCFLLALVASGKSIFAQTFRAGVASIDISPTTFPRKIAGGFIEGRGEKNTDALHARCFVLDDGKTKLAFAIVDTCMMTQALIDEAKSIASAQCGIAVDHMMVSATHTHSAPAAMGCLGTRQDQEYAAFLAPKIAEGIVAAAKRLQPARIGWASIDDWEHTHNRRWIRKAGSELDDPFGDKSARANMHPGYLSKEVIGPSGPVDPELIVISIQTKDGKPMGVLANYSQHYFGSTPVSADYYGAFCRHLAQKLGQPGDGNGAFVCAMSQGTSGDLMWMDYGAEKKDLKLDAYAEAVAEYAAKAVQKVKYHNFVPLEMVEKILPMAYRVPDEKRLAWARPIAEKIQDDLPKDKQEVYAREAIILHERQKTSLKLQAIRIGDLTIATLPNEVFAITGLKLKAQSPFAAHFNIELANGAEGYIPPPEQHALGGYTTWPARTAGLEVQAEPKEVETLLGALEEVTGKPRRAMQSVHGRYAKAVLDAKPVGYWRLDEAAGRAAINAVPGGVTAQVFDGAAWYLPGVGSGTGYGGGEVLTPAAFSGEHQINRALHLAGGRIEANMKTGGQASVVLWFWLGHESGASERSGTLMEALGARLVAQQTLDHRVRLSLDQSVTAESWRADEWHFAVLVRDGDKVRLHFDGVIAPVLEVPTNSEADKLVIGNGVEGKLDEIAVFDRALVPNEIAGLWKISGVATAATAATPSKSKMESAPLPPEESLKKIHVPDGFEVELVAAEPLVLDPVAFDWDERGRLWVVEMADYPLGMDGHGKPAGRVRILEDTDGDGRYDKSSIFADDLNFPTGILCWRGGCLVTAAPDVLFLKDTKGAGRADVRQKLLTGFLEGNQQLRVNGLRWGLDGWVYCANGGHHVNYGKDIAITSTLTGEKIALGSRDFRFKPDTGEFDPLSGPSQFGRNRDAWGHWFGVQNSYPIWHYVLEDRYLRRNPYVASPNPRNVMTGSNPAVFPLSGEQKRYHTFNQAGHFTSACAATPYLDAYLFGDDGQLHSFTCEPVHDVVQHFILEDDGVSFKAHRAESESQPDFFASEDRWCRPVMTRTGPDGALWVADMYRYMIEHPQWLPQNGKDDFLPFYRAGEDKGRIYRVYPKGKRPGPVPRLDALEVDGDVDGLIALLESPNGWVRDRAQMLLQSHADKKVVFDLEKV